jgi:hypothetical protein
MAKSSAVRAKETSMSAKAARERTRPGGQARELSFSPAKGGMISRTSQSSAGDGPYQEPEHTIHPSMSHAIAHLKRTFGHLYEGEKD